MVSSGIKVSIIYISLDLLSLYYSFQNTMQACSQIGVRYLRSHGEAYNKSMHPANTASVAVLIGGMLHT